MKINFVVSGIFKSGGMKIICEYANRLTGRGHDVIMYYPFAIYNFYEGNPESYLSLRKNYWSLKNYLKIKETLKDFYPVKFRIKMVPVLNNYFLRDADATIATIWHTSYSVNKLNDRKGEKIYLVQDYEIWNSNPEKVNQSYRLPLTRITISSHLKNLLETKFGAASTVILNGIDFSKYGNSIPEKSKDGSVSLVFIDYRLDKKNVEACIEAIEILKSRYKNLNVSCFGLKRFHDLPGYIKFIQNPEESEIVKIYSEADIFLFTSKEEGFGLPPAEAMACRCAVVTSPVGAIPEYSEDNESAIFIDPDNINEITNHISKLIESEELLEKISQNGYKSVREKLNWDKSIKRFEKVIFNKNNLN